MAGYQALGAAMTAGGSVSTAPLVVLYERDDAVAVPLLSQLRMAGYDVRAARTPVDLFDLLGKLLVSLVLVDLGAATAGRREFWVALDAQRRGRALQVMTFRQTSPVAFLAPDEDPSARALADVEVTGPQDFHKIVQGVRQRIPVHGAPAAGPIPLPGGASQVGLSPFAAGAMPAPPSWPLAVPPGTEAYRLMPHAASVSPQAAMGVSPHGPPMGTQGPAPYASPSVYGGPPSSVAPQWQPASLGAGYAPAPYRPAPASVPAWDASPFANPARANPFAPAGESSPFAQPYAANPFTGEAVPGGPAPFSAQPPSAHMAPSWSSPSGSNFGTPPSDPSYAPRAFGERSALYPSPQPPARGPLFGGDSLEPAPVSSATANISDTWIPPDEDAAVQTGIVPEMAFQERRRLSSQRAGMEWGASPSRAEWDAPRSQHPNMPAVQETTRNLPAVQSQAEQALGTVLVEGALLTPSKLEVLRGIQAMLASVRMDYKLGELALLFRFLSPDQLLAALLVSRGMVTPQQIAGLGRAKQELAASGMNHDLESMLIMFRMLTPEQLRQIRAELL
jgi:hypothetical protein